MLHFHWLARFNPNALVTLESEPAGSTSISMRSE